jgi:mannan endo-1,4-beta-mannosidase
MQLREIRKGMNFWQAIVLEASPDPADRERLEQSLLQLKAIGIGFVRILASTQGCSSPFSIKPAMENGAEGDEAKSAGVLLRLLSRLERHGLQAIVVLGNFWSWSGGFPAYAEWEGRKPFPVIGPGSSLFQMAGFFRRAARIYSDPAITKRYQRLAGAILDLVPSGHPAILSYQLANEPTPCFNSKDLFLWALEQTRFIRARSPLSPVTLGGIGEGPLPIGTKTDLKRIHSLCRFDALTAHIWPENWGWYDPKRPDQTLEPTLKKTKAYLERHARLAKEIGVPLLLEELNLARDGKSLDPESTTRARDRFLGFVHEELSRLSAKGFPVAGIAYWTWEQDPPHEPRGWYSIHTGDESTLRLIRGFNSPT